MTYFYTTILSIVEGLTEFLPISSTGHLILTSKLLQIPSTEFLKSFEIIIQLGAILSVVFLYHKTLIKNFTLNKKLIVSFIPTATIGLIAYPFVKGYLLDNSTITLTSLFLGGIILIILEKIHKEKETHSKDLQDISYVQALFLGIFQSIAIIPGVSRSAATIIGGLFLGLKRKVAVEYSFLLAIPTMLAATSLDIFKTQLKFTSPELTLLLIGFIISFITALISIKFLLSFIKNHNFIFFGVYRIILATSLYFILK
jgi:undecaprenyl-diphosphatase